MGAGPPDLRAFPAAVSQETNLDVLVAVGEHAQG